MVGTISHTVGTIISHTVATISSILAIARVAATAATTKATMGRVSSKAIHSRSLSAPSAQLRLLPVWVLGSPPCCLHV